jgi:hypothetical protein
MPPAPPPVPGDGGPGGPDIAGAVRQAVQEAMAQMGPGAGGAGGAGGKATTPKVDINTVATDTYQLKQMFLHFLKVQGIELPDNILNGPNRDPVTGLPSQAATGGSDPAQGAGAGAGPQSAIKPIQPIQGAFPAAGGAGGGGGGGGDSGGSKTASWVEVEPVGQATNFTQMRSKVAAVAQMCRQRSK